MEYSARVDDCSQHPGACDARGLGQDFAHLSSFEERKDLPHDAVLSLDRPNQMEAVAYF